MVSKNIGQYDVGALADVSHFVAVPSAGPSVDVNPILIPKEEIGSKGYQYCVPQDTGSISTSSYNCKGLFFTSREEWKLDKLYVTHRAAIGDAIGLRVCTFNVDTVDAVLHAENNASDGTGSIIVASVEIPPIVLPANKRIGLIAMTEGKAASFASAIMNGALAATGMPVTEFGYCYFSGADVNISNVFSFSSGTSPYSVGARVY